MAELIKDWGFAAKCPSTGKVQLASIEQANLFKKSLRKRVGSKTHVYRCPQCKLWHIGHNRTKKRIKEIKQKLERGILRPD